VLGLYAGRGLPEESENEKLNLMISDLVDWFTAEFGKLHGGIRCETILGDDPRSRSTKCPGLTIGTYEKVKALLIEYGFDLAGSIRLIATAHVMIFLLAEGMMSTGRRPCRLPPGSFQPRAVRRSSPGAAWSANQHYNIVCWSGSALEKRAGFILRINLKGTDGRAFDGMVARGESKISSLPGDAMITRTPLERWIAEKIGSKPEDLSRESIERYQLAKLQETLAWAEARSAFYKERLAGLDAPEAHCLGDLCRFPFTTAEEVKRNPLPFLCVSQGEIERVVTLRTSGTAGEPKRIYFTREDQELTVDFFHRGMATLVGPGDKVLILLPGECPGSVGDLLAAGLERLGAHGIVHGPGQDYALVVRQGSLQPLNGVAKRTLADLRN